MGWSCRRRFVKANCLMPWSKRASSLGPVLRSRLTNDEGVALGAISGLYVPLWARDTLVGLLAVERIENQEPFTDADADIVADVARHAGLAIDNARWFRRLRTLGAEEERGRIAREMHDRLGQSLAYVAISLDRMATESRNGNSCSAAEETGGRTSGPGRRGAQGDPRGPQQTDRSPR